MARQPHTTVICITPVRNEAWILERFLECTRIWADHIVIVDHCSEDNSREIARRFPEVTLVTYDQESFDEIERRSLLIETARSLTVAGKRLIMALDADEALSANWIHSGDWQQALQAEPGTTLSFRWVNVMPGVDRYWLSEHKAFGFMDDGSHFQSLDIHGERLPRSEGGDALAFEEVRVLHFQYVDWNRMKSKQRWYQCWERVHHPTKRPITLYRQYHRMDAIAEAQTRSLPDAWLEAYEAYGIDMKSFNTNDSFWWDRRVLEMLAAHGAEYFSKVNIWDVDWQAMAREVSATTNGRALQDPRNMFEKAVHRLLMKTQPLASHLPVRAMQKLLQLAGW